MNAVMELDKITYDSAYIKVALKQPDKYLHTYRIFSLHDAQIDIQIGGIPCQSMLFA